MEQKQTFNHHHADSPGTNSVFSEYSFTAYRTHMASIIKSTPDHMVHLFLKTTLHTHTHTEGARLVEKRNPGSSRDGTSRGKMEAINTDFLNVAGLPGGNFELPGEAVAITVMAVCLCVETLQNSSVCCFGRENVDE